LAASDLATDGGLMDDLVIASWEPGDELSAARVLSAAILSNPIHVAVLQGQSEDQRGYLEGRFASLLLSNSGEVLVAKHGGRILGVLRSYPCEGHRRSPEQAGEPDQADEAGLVDLDARIAYWHQVWDRHDPPEFHIHLGPVGVLPEFQGQGIGRGLMVRFCAGLDSEGKPAFLETDKPDNVRFYEKSGFRVVDQTHLFGIAIFFMWRPGQG
jgi:ribosomal protein S18 acetylase RimI-like enzyme